MFDDNAAAQRRRWCVKHGRAADSSLESRRLNGRFSKLAQKIAESEQPWLNADTKEQDSQPLPLQMGFDVAIKMEQNFIVQRDRRSGRPVVGGVRYGQVETLDTDAALGSEKVAKAKTKTKGQKKKKQKKQKKKTKKKKKKTKKKKKRQKKKKQKKKKTKEKKKKKKKKDEEE